MVEQILSIKNRVAASEEAVSDLTISISYKSECIEVLTAVATLSRLLFCLERLIEQQAINLFFIYTGVKIFSSIKVWS